MKNLIMIIAMILLILLAYNIKNIKEGFYYYYPPSNCMQNVFGNINCFPPFYFPFYFNSF